MVSEGKTGLAIITGGPVSTKKKALEAAKERLEIVGKERLSRNIEGTTDQGLVTPRYREQPSESKPETRAGSTSEGERLARKAVRLEINADSEIPPANPFLRVRKSTLENASRGDSKAIDILRDKVKTAQRISIYEMRLKRLRKKARDIVDQQSLENAASGIIRLRHNRIELDSGEAVAVHRSIKNALDRVESNTKARLKPETSPTLPKISRGKKRQTPRGLRMDQRRRAGTVAPEVARTEAERKLVERWKKNPGRLDREGFDTPGSTRIPRQRDLDRG